jgi:hypothetical protein
MLKGRPTGGHHLEWNFRLARAGVDHILAGRSAEPLAKARENFRKFRSFCTKRMIYETWTEAEAISDEAGRRKSGQKEARTRH